VSIANDLMYKGNYSRWVIYTKWAERLRWPKNYVFLGWELPPRLGERYSTLGEPHPREWRYPVPSISHKFSLFCLGRLV